MLGNTFGHLPSDFFSVSGLIIFSLLLSLQASASFANTVFSSFVPSKLVPISIPFLSSSCISSLPPSPFCPLSAFQWILYSLLLFLFSYKWRDSLSSPVDHRVQWSLPGGSPARTFLPCFVPRSPIGQISLLFFPARISDSVFLSQGKSMHLRRVFDKVVWKKPDTERLLASLEQECAYHQRPSPICQSERTIPFM